MSLALVVDHELCARRYRKGNPIGKPRERRLTAFAWLTTVVWVIAFSLGVANVPNEFSHGDLSSNSLRRLSTVDFGTQVAAICLCGAAMLV